MDRRISKLGPLNVELNERVSPLTKKLARTVKQDSYDKRNCANVQRMLYKIYRAPLCYDQLVCLAFYMQDCARYYQSSKNSALMREASLQILNFAEFYKPLIF